ncbi:ATP-grasp domain-containing protein [Rahnella woolbedingensis]|uniref:Biotin carboxylase n=1 Tax=Rahnella woolbedingensis TaxID=1510574 RepID=A0A419N9H6_9GAMM|nr:biotin carboxylase [Rahnella woolbedingensis]RJT44352.1 biotin carboxylase [Rahnella woolbedingensis]
MSTPCFVVVGYNNVRIYDVEKMRKEALKNFDAKMVLITEKKGATDDEFADLVVEASFDSERLHQSLCSVSDALAKSGLLPVGILPFSDRGVPLGALLAESFSLHGATPQQALAGLDKQIFRQLDAQSVSHPAGYRTVTSQQVSSLEDLISRVKELGGKAFIKPAKEGNSRGCQVIESVEDCQAVWLSLTPYHEAGVLVETLIESASEFSWDYVAGKQWITEKHTTQGHYRAEYQQVVPACLSPEDESLLRHAGEHMRHLVSPQNGAWHNEIFLLPGATAAVETNMRPAGMHIWDLAMLSFENFNPWQLWLSWAAQGTVASEPLRQTHYAGIRMLRARQSGTLVSLPDGKKLAEELGISAHQVKFSAKPGDMLNDEIKSNADFIGQIILRDTDHAQLLNSLNALATTIENAAEIE